MFQPNISLFNIEQVFQNSLVLDNSYRLKIVLKKFLCQYPEQKLLQTTITIVYSSEDSVATDFTKSKERHSPSMKKKQINN